jgi:hypothetical protein
VIVQIGAISESQIRVRHFEHGDLCAIGEINCGTLLLSLRASPLYKENAHFCLDTKMHEKDHGHAG